MDRERWMDGWMDTCRYVDRQTNMYNNYVERNKRTAVETRLGSQSRVASCPRGRGRSSVVPWPGVLGRPVGAGSSER